MTPKELKFVSEVAHGSSPRVAYKAVFNPKTENQNSVRAMAAKIMRRPGVREAIDSIKAEIQADVVASCVWDARAAMIARINDTRRLDMEITRQLEGIDIEIQGIESDENLSDSEKKKLKGRVMQRNVIGRSVQIKQSIYADLDKSVAGKADETTIPIGLQLLQLDPRDCIQEDPDAYAVSSGASKAG